MAPRPDIAYYHYVGGFGLAEAGRSNAIALQWAGYNVARMGSGEVGPDCKKEVESDVAIHHWHPVWTLDHTKLFKEGHRPKRRIAYWAWECERSFHQGMIDTVHHFDEIWTPSDYCSDLLKPLGVPTKTVRHAIRAPYEPKARRRGAAFRVLCVFDAWSRLDRKNPLGAVKAFLKAFPQDANVELVMKSLHLHEELNDPVLKNRVAELMELTDKDPRITYINDYLSEFELQNLFMESDCVISLHRSEGFGLNAARAINYGVPLVATNYGGCAEWMDYAHKVSWEPCQLKSNDYYPKGAWWAEPSVDDAAQKLRWIYENGDEAIKQAAKGAQKTDFSFDTLAQSMRHLLTSANIFPSREGIAGAATIQYQPTTG